MSTRDRPRIALVLSAGGLRGAAHLGVMRRLTELEIPIDVVVGTSAGAVVAAYFAAVGLTVEQLIDEARAFRGRHLVAHSLASRSWPWLGPVFRPWSGCIPSRLDQLQTGRFDRLHHGVEALGIVCHDLSRDRPCYLSTASHGGVGLREAVAASAAIPHLFAPQRVRYDGIACQLTDGGVSDPLPVEFATRPGLAADRLVISDCRRDRSPGEVERLPSRHLVYLQPRLGHTTTLRAPRATLIQAVEAGDAAVTPDVSARLRGWLGRPGPERPRGSS